MGFIRTFILPKDVDFNQALQAQAHITRAIIESLLKACVENDTAALATISNLVDEAQTMKTKNMKELLDVFIAPYDKESIYRIITQMDWVALSVKHFLLEIRAYGVSSTGEYQSIFNALVDMAALLELGISHLAKKDPSVIAPDIDRIHDKYDHVVELCAHSVADLLKQDDYRHVIVHKEILAQLKDVAKRIHLTANSLEDMAIKVV